MIATLRFFVRLSAGHLRKHRLEALLCLIGVAVGVAVVVAIDSAVAACVSSFRGAVDSLAERSTHSIFAEFGGIGDEQFIQLANSRPPCPIAPVIERSVLVERIVDSSVPTKAPKIGAVDPSAAPVAGQPLVGRLIGVDIFSERQLRSFTNMRGTLGDDAFREFMTQPDRVVLVDELAGRLGVSAGQSVRLSIGNRRREVRVVAIIAPEGVARSQLSDILIADLATAQELADSLGKIDRIDVRLETPEQESALIAIMPKGLVLRSTQQQSMSMTELIASYKLNLNSLSLMAAFVAVFIVYNAMLVSVRQRAPTLGILRCLGASRGQIVALYLLEAGIVAAIGGLLGVLGGWALARGLVGSIASTINDLYTAVRPSPVALDGAMFAKGLLVACASCLAGALVPLIQASRTPPINAMRQSAVAGRSSRAAGRLFIAGMVLLALSLAVYALPGESPMAGFAMALLMGLGFAALCPLLTRWICLGVIRIVRPRQNLPMQMAAAGVARSLGITGVAVAAMMLATAMTISIRTMVSSFRGALDHWLDRRFSADVLIGPELLVNHKVESTIDPAVERWISRQPELRSMVHFRAIYSDVGGKPTLISGTEIDPVLQGGSWPIKSRIDPSIPFDPANDVLISEPLAGRLHLKSGDTIDVQTPTGPRRFNIHGVFYDFGNERGHLILERQTFARAWKDDQLTSLHVKIQPGLDPQTVAARWSQELRKDYPVVANSYLQVKTEILAIFDRTFAVTHVLAWLAAAVAFCGLAGSLLALAMARQRDYSVLAAVGMSGRQTAVWVISQGALIAWTSAAIACIAGTALAYVMSYVIQYRSFGWSIPTSPYPRYWVESFIISSAAAVVAGIYPIYRLVRTPPAVNLRQE